MERRKFLKATTMLPFFNSVVFRKSSFQENGLYEKNHFQDDNRRDFFYKPENAWVGDFIPLYTSGQFHLFYLHDWRDKERHGEGIPWYRITTKDFVNFTEHGEAIPCGTKEEQDLVVGTGS